MRGKTVPKIMSVLRRELAWKLQMKDRRALDLQTQKLLNAAVKAAAKTAGTNSSVEIDGLRHNKPAREMAKPKLKEGTKLVRKWQGHHYEVLVLNDGKQFRYHNKTYDSLSKVAKVITGAHWSGPRFFGLNKLTETK